MRILLIDDDPTVRSMLRAQLSRLHRVDEIEEAMDGEEGLRVAREFRPDVIVLDVEMPVMTGIEALPLLRDLVPAAVIVLNSAAMRSLPSDVIDLTDGCFNKLGDGVPTFIASL